MELRAERRGRREEADRRGERGGALPPRSPASLPPSQPGARPVRPSVCPSGALGKPRRLLLLLDGGRRAWLAGRLPGWPGMLQRQARRGEGGEGGEGARGGDWLREGRGRRARGCLPRSLARSPRLAGAAPGRLGRAQRFRHVGDGTLAPQLALSRGCGHDEPLPPAALSLSPHPPPPRPEFFAGSEGLSACRRARDVAGRARERESALARGDARPAPPPPPVKRQMLEKGYCLRGCC